MSGSDGANGNGDGNGTELSPVSLAREHHLVTARTARYFTLGAAPEHAHTVWFALHGYAQLAERFLRPFADVIPEGVMIVAPEGLSRFYLEMPRADRGHMKRVGAAWMTKEDRLSDIADTRGWLDSVYRTVINSVVEAQHVEPQIGVLAFSQGVATAMRWLAGGVPQPSRIVMWAGSIADDADTFALQMAMKSADVVFVAGTADPFFTEKAKRMIHAQWSELDIPVREVLYDGDHALHAETLRELLKLNRP